MLYLSGISLALFPPPRREALLAALADFRAEGGRIGFDSNYRAELWSVEEARPVHQRMLSLTDIALLTLDDECRLHGPHEARAAADRALQLGCAEVVIARRRRLPGRDRRSAHRGARSARPARGGQLRGGRRLCGRLPGRAHPAAIARRIRRGRAPPCRCRDRASRRDHPALRHAHSLRLNPGTTKPARGRLCHDTIRGSEPLPLAASPAAAPAARSVRRTARPGSGHGRRSPARRTG